MMNQLITLFQAHLGMGGYASFVWPAYLAMFSIFLLSIIFPIRKTHRIKRILRAKFES